MIMTLHVSWPLVALSSHSWSSLVCSSAPDWTNALVSLILSYSLFPWFWGLALEPQQGDKALAVLAILSSFSSYCL